MRKGEDDQHMGAVVEEGQKKLTSLLVAGFKLEKVRTNFEYATKKTDLPEAYRVINDIAEQ